MVIDDLEESGSAEKIEILQAQPSIQRLARDLFLFGVKKNKDGKMEEKLQIRIRVKGSKTPQVQDATKIGMEEATHRQLKRQDGDSAPRQKQDTKPPRPLSSMDLAEAPPQMLNDNYHQGGCAREESITALLRPHPIPHKPMPEIIPENISFSPSQQQRLPSRHVVGIFSRSPQKDYYWLRDMLQSYSGQVQGVRHGYMLESGSVHWKRLVTECTLGILYHNKKTGRSLISDVPGALYDEELRYLSEHLGRRNVLVVVDNAEDYSTERGRILENQPSVQRLTRGLEIFGCNKEHLLETEDPQGKEIIRLLHQCHAD